MISHKMEFEMENYLLRATEEGKIERFWKANQFKPDRWKELKGGKHKGYLRITLYLTSGKRKVLVHRLVYLAYNQDWNIWDSGFNNVIDHRDRNKSNNKIENLQQVTQQQNTFNTNAKGYSWCEATQKWRGDIMYDGKNNYLGEFEKEDDARQAYLAKKATLHIIR